MYFLDCSGGVSGDMLLSAFIDASNDKEGILGILTTAGSVMSPTNVSTRTIDVLGTEARILDIEFQEPGHDHIHGVELRSNLETALDKLGLTTGKTYALNCLDTILKAESVVHNEPIETIHLHETGSADTLVDLCGMGYFFEHLDLLDNEVLATPVSVGSGNINISHGIVDVPAPATKLILEGMQYNPGPVEDELATPTGVALLKNLIKGFVDCVPPDAVPIGRGTGTKRFREQGFVNVLALYRGNTNGQGAGLL